MNQNAVSTTIEEAFRCYYRPLCLYALHYLHDTFHAEDIVQECFTALWERMDGGAAVTDAKSYLYIMVRNRCFRAVRQECLIDAEADLTDLAERFADEEEYEERSFIEARMWTAIDALPTRQREALLLCKRDGLSYNEIAQRLGISVNTVKNQVSKALHTLRENGRKVYLFFFG